MRNLKHVFPEQMINVPKLKFKTRHGYRVSLIFINLDRLTTISGGGVYWSTSWSRPTSHISNRMRDSHYYFIVLALRVLSAL